MTRPNPYVGPRPFQTGETLYGRDREIRELLDLLIAERILLLYSPSGAGKSSLIQAGLIPPLEEEGFQVLPVMRVNLERQVARQDGKGNRYISSLLLSLEEGLPSNQRMPPDKLASFPLADYLDHRPKPDASPGSEMLIFDQFEEILILDPTDREAKAAFFTQVGAALRDRRRWALFAMREDYVAALDPYLRPLPTRLGNTYRLDLLGADAGCQAIQRPARQAGVDFTVSAAKKLVDDLRRMQVQRPDGTTEEQLGQYVEPVQLQVVCYRLWEKMPSDGLQITEMDVESVGDVDTALAGYYADQVRAIALETGVSERAIRQWCDRQLITEQGIRSQVLMGHETSEGLGNRVIRLLENAHLVRADRRRGAVWFELAHDRMIRPIRANNSAWFQANLTLLQRQAALWESEDQPAHLLLRDQALSEAEEWAAAHADELNEVERDFLKACQEARTREHEARALAEQTLKLEAAQKLAEAERHRAEEQALAARQLRQRALFLAGALVVAGVLAVIAVLFSRQASQNAQRASVNASAAQAASTLAVENASTAQINASIAQAASTEAVAQQVTAQVAREQAVAEEAKAEAASTRAVAQQATAEAESDRADTEADIALARQLAVQSFNYVGDQLDLALLLGIEAYRVFDTTEAKSALLTALQSGLNLKTVPFGEPFPSQGAFVNSLAFSPVGEELASGNNQGDVALWDVQTQTQLASLKIRTPVYGVSFSPDGTILASNGPGGAIRLWDVENDQLLDLPGESGIFEVISLAINPGGKTLAVGSTTGVIRVWNMEAREVLLDLRGHFGSVWSLAWSPDGRRLASGSADSTVRVWDPDTGNTFFTLAGHTHTVRSVAWSPNGRVIASGSADSTIRMWDAASGQPIGQPLTGHTDGVLSLAFSRDSKILASGSADRTILLWDVTNPALPQQIDRLTHHTHWVLSLAFSQKARNLLASSSHDETIVLREVVIQQQLGTSLADIDGEAKSAAYNPDGALLIVDASGVQDITNGQPAGGYIPLATSIAALSLDGKTLAASGTDGAIGLWDVATSQSLPIAFEAGSSNVSALAFSPEGERLASGGCAEADADGNCIQGEIHLFDAASGQLLQPFSGHTGSVASLAFSRQGNRLASGSEDNTIIVWDLANSQKVGLPLTGHTDRVTSLGFSSDGRSLASGGADGKLILWDVATGQPIGVPLSESGEPLTALAFRPDGQELVSGSSSGAVIAWDVGLASWIERACNVAGRNFRRNEWDQFFPGQPYRQTCGQWPLETPTPVP